MMDENNKKTGTLNAVTLKELRADFYKCRDFELSNLWQRSIFLSVFLILCFTGYGFILVKIIETRENIVSLSLFNLVGIVVGMLSLLFSILWIMMAKGSKAWYEVYETAIYDIEKNPDLEIEEKYRIENLPTKENGIDCKILTNRGGAYSVSKINIGIGQICFWAWCIVVVAHSLFNIINISCHLCCNSYCSAPLIIALVVSFVLPIIAILFAAITISSEWLKSNHLRKKEINK